VTITLQLPPEVEERLAAQAAQLGLSLDAYALRLLAAHVSAAASISGDAPIPSSPPLSLPRAASARQLLSLSPEERDRVLAAQAADAESLYRDDLARPAEERDLTAFTVLDGEPFLDDE
jgi:hypothetical protein